MILNDSNDEPDAVFVGAATSDAFAEMATNIATIRNKLDMFADIILRPRVPIESR